MTKKKNCIYQYWDGEIKESCRAGVEAMKAYAARIDADYIFEENPQFLKKQFGLNFGSYSPHYGAFKPVFDSSFDGYDKVMFVDTDVFPVEGLTDNIFDEFTSEIGICTEPMQPALRKQSGGRITNQSDEYWAFIVEKMLFENINVNRHFPVTLPRYENGDLKIYNTGMVLYSKHGRRRARNMWVYFKRYFDLMCNYKLDPFYTCDQPYLHAMLSYTEHDVQEMDNGWNSYIHYFKSPDGMRYLCDWRDDSTKFVHVQFAGADNLTTEQHHVIVNEKDPDKWSKVNLYPPLRIPEKYYNE